MGLLLLFVVSAAPVSVAAPGFQVVGLEPVVADALLDRFVTQLTASGAVKVTTARDIAQALGVERQKQLLGCTEEATTCLSELAGGLGADVVLTANIVKVGSGFTVNVRFVALKDGRAVLTASERVGTMDALQDWLDRQASSAARQLGPVLAPGAAPIAEVTAAPGRSPWPWVAAGSALAVGAVGVGVFISGKQDFTELKETSEPTRVEALASGGPVKQRLGVGFMIAGGAGLAASLTWAALRKDDALVVGFAPSPGGAVALVQGRWP